MGDPIVLVHGSWHDGSAWQQVIDHLAALGHDAHGPTMAGHGPGADKRVTHAQCTQSIVEYIVDNDLQQIVLLGHSFGGTVIAQVAELIPHRIKRLVFWDAFVLRDGESVNDNLPPATQQLYAALAARSADGTMMLPYLLWRELYINDADQALAAWSYRQLSPEPYGLFVERLDLKRFYSLAIPRSYLYCTDDTALPPGEEWGWHPRMSRRLGLYRLVQTPGSHELLFSNPQRLANKIIEAGRD